MPRRGGRVSGNTLLIAGLFLVVGAAGGLGVAFVTGGLPWIKSEPSVTVKDVQRLNELSSVQWTESVIVPQESGGRRFIPDFLRGQSVLLIAVGDVRAGVDLDKLKKGDVSAKDGRVTIDLPAPEILSSGLDEQKTRVYDRDRGLLDFNPDKNLEQKARREAVSRLENSARKNGILDEAQTNAETGLRAFVQSLGFDEVRFE